jgi:hypothetical protein
MKNHYTYIYLDPTKPGRFKYDGLEMTFLFRPFYVGKGEAGRVWAHIGEARNHNDRNIYKCNTIRKILKDYSEHELREYVVFPHRNISDAKSRKLEIEMIALIGRYNPHDKKKKGPLTNETDGGDGVSGHVPTKEQKEKREATKLRRGSYKKGSETARIRGTLVNGVKSNFARKFLITEPNGKEHIVHGRYFAWIKEHGLSEYIFALWMDKGPVSGRLYKKFEYMRSWSIQHI